ncbi:MAG TPA: hypothetical protein VLA49_16435 [Anaerolineales bacterium]|nr:hypothetical protein [Anaerolineales bacterium]
MINRLRPPGVKKLVFWLLVAGVLFQVALLAITAIRDIFPIPGVIGQHALWRSAVFFQGQRFADFVSFLNEKIPQHARVVLPPKADSENKILSTTPYMQFYLAPRQVINCPDLECLGDISSENTYVLVVDQAQLEVLDEFSHLQMFDQKWGLASAGQGPPKNSTPIQGFSSFWQIAGAGVLPLLWMLTLTCSGLLLIRHVLPEIPWFAQAALGYGVSMAGFTLLVGLGMLFKLHLVSSLVLGATALIIFFAAVTHLTGRRRRFIKPWAPAAPKAGLFGALWQASLFTLGLLAISISVGRSYHSTDAILLWGAKGYGLASTGTLKSVVNWGTNTVPYPLHVPLLVASFKMLFAESLPASKLFFPAYYLGLIALTYQALLQAKRPRSFARLATLLIVTSPLIFRHATIAYANLALSFYLVAAAVTLQSMLSSEQENGLADLVALLSGFLFAAAAWSRPEGLPLAWAGIGMALIVTLAGQSQAKSTRKIAFLVSPLGLYTLYWYLVYTQVYLPDGVTNTMVGNGLSQIFSGNLHPGEAVYLFRSLITRLIDVNTWGALGFFLLVSLPVFFLMSKQRGRTGSLNFYLGLLWVVMILGMYFLASYDPDHDISWWVSTGLDRMLMPGILLSLLGGLGLVDLLDHREEPASPPHPEERF